MNWMLFHGDGLGIKCNDNRLWKKRNDTCGGWWGWAKRSQEEGKNRAVIFPGLYQRKNYNVNLYLQSSYIFHRFWQLRKWFITLSLVIQRISALVWMPNRSFVLLNGTSKLDNLHNTKLHYTVLLPSITLQTALSIELITARFSAARLPRKDLRNICSSLEKGPSRK